MGHPYRNPEAGSFGPLEPIGELRRVRAVLVVLVGILLFLLIVFAVSVRSLGLRFALSVPGIALALMAALLAFFALSLPVEAGVVPTGLVLKLLYGTRRVSWEEIRHGRRSVLNVDLLRGETALLMLAFKIRASPTRLCLLPLTGWRREQSDLSSAGSYETAVDRRLREFERTEEDQRS